MTRSRSKQKSGTDTPTVRMRGSLTLMHGEYDPQYDEGIGPGSGPA